MEKYNGWNSYESWNVALWIGNNEGLYNLARDVMLQQEDATASCIEFIDLVGQKTTGDNVEYTFDNCIEYFENEFEETNLFNGVE
jgi:hypothetical protein